MSWAWLVWGLAAWVGWIVWHDRKSIAAQWRQRAEAQRTRRQNAAGMPDKLRRKLLAEVEAIRAKRGLPPRKPADLSYGSAKPASASTKSARTGLVVNSMPPQAGAVAVLAGTGLAQETQAAVLRCWRENRHNSWRKLLKEMANAIGGLAWAWPWFEESLARFQARGEFPDLPAWSAFETPEPEPMPVNAQDGLCWLDMADARAVLKRQGVKPPGSKKMDVMNALFQVPFENWRDVAIENWQVSERERETMPDGYEISQIKIELLAHAMGEAEYVAERYRQLHELVECKTFAGMQLDTNDALIEIFQRNHLASAPHPGLPPFFPGDKTALRALRR